MRKTLILCGILLSVCLSGCQAHVDALADSDSVPESYPVIQAQEANQEYDSLEEFQNHSSRPAFLLNDNGSRSANATSSNACLN